MTDAHSAPHAAACRCADAADDSAGDESVLFLREQDVEDATIARAYDRVAEDYDAYYSGGCFQAENEVVREWLAPRVREHRVLDIGCGTGLLLHLCPDIAPDSYLGVDASSNMLEVARRKHPGYAFAKGNMCDLSGIEDASFSSVVSLWSFQYAMRPMSAVREIRRVLQPRGYLSLLTNAPKHLRRKSYLHHGAEVPQIKWSCRDLKELCGAFEDVRLWGLNAFADALRLLPARWVSIYLRLESRILFPVAADSFLYVALGATRPAVRPAARPLPSLPAR